MLKSLLRQVLRRRAPSEDAGPAQSSLNAADLQWEEGERMRMEGDQRAAEARYRAALRLDPAHRDAWMSLGAMCYRDRRLALAHEYFRAVLTSQPNDPEALNELGLVELAYGNRTDARSTFEQVLDRDPTRHEAWNNLGLALAGQGQLEEACRAFRRALALQPRHLIACTNLGLACRDLNRPLEARDAFEKARGIDPAAVEVRVGLALALQDLGELETARIELEQALELAPGAADALCALGALMLRLGRPEDARQLLARARAVAPEDAEAELATAHLLLAEGAYREGWERYEARLRSRASPRRSYAVPHWNDPAPPLRRRVLVYGEQGLGEQIMFASMLAEFAAQADVTLDCEPRLRTLFARSFDTVALLEEPEAQGSFDACIPIGSLGRYYRRDEGEFRAHAGYLKADPDRVATWRARLAALGNGTKVGIAWRGGLASTGRALRSLEADALAPLAKHAGVHWVNLQHDAAANEIEAFARYAPLLHDAAAVSDMEETAALMSALDLVIAPCSTTVHLAGALARPVWVLTPFAPAWRYRLEGERMPWYPSARLLRQPAPGAWQPVLDALSAALGEFRARH